MLANEAIAAVISIVTGYLLGSIPTAYLVTRLALGKDVRRLGGGNVGGLNTYREVGLWAAVLVAIVDLSKGAGAVAIAYWLLKLPPVFVLLSGLASAIGHNWMVWLRFSGGKGMGVTVGALFVLMPVYGFWPGILVFLGVIAIPYSITRNVALSMGTGLLFLPLITWLGTGSGTATIIGVVLGLVIAVKFLPTAKQAWAKAGTKKDFIFDRGLRTGRGKS